jgi:hypothetical protein
MMNRNIENAKIVKVTLGNGDHGPDGWVHLEMNGSGQGFGGYHLGGEAMSIFVLGILKTLEVDDWSKLVGTYCRVDHDWGHIYRIGHIIKDKWFDPKEAFEELREKNKFTRK